MIVDQLVDAGIREFVFVIGYLGEKIQDYVDTHYPQLSCSFVTQNDRKGIGHAIWLTRDAVSDDDEVIIVLGDTICEYDINSILKSEVSQLGVHKVDDPRSFGVAALGEQDKVLSVVEKPLIPRSNMAMVGIYYIRETKIMFDTLNRLVCRDCDTEDEFSLTNAIEEMIVKEHIPFHAFRVNNWFDCGKKETLLSTNAILLKKTDNRSIEEQHNTVIIHPVSIAEGCVIKNSIIGPNVTIGRAYQNRVFDYQKFHHRFLCRTGRCIASWPLLLAMTPLSAAAARVSILAIIQK